MASNETSPNPIIDYSASSTEQGHNAAKLNQQNQDEPPSSTPVEMSHIDPPPEQQNSTNISPVSPLSNNSKALEPPSQALDEPSKPSTPTPVVTPPTSSPQNPTSQLPPSTSLPVEKQAAPGRSESIVAIGPSTTDSPSTASQYLQPSSSNSSEPAVLITLILLTGARHPFRIDSRYLQKRNVPSNSSTNTDTEKVDPYNISIYTVKELIWRDWREEWESRPTIPGSIRLIHFGKLLEDRMILKDLKFNTQEPNIIHMTVRPQEVVDEEELAKKSGKKGKRYRSSTTSGGGGSVEEGESAGCRCCSMM